MPKIITMGNQKGGVGKTTTTANIADALGRCGNRVLVIDADPQGNCTSVFLREIHLRERFSLVKALEAPPDKGLLSPNACRTHSDNVDVIPNNIRCMLWERSVASTPDSFLGFSRIMRKDKGLRNYDYILIDTPPNIGAMVNNALMVSDYALIPIPTGDQFALDGLAIYLNLLQNIRSQNEKLRLLGVVLTKFDSREAIYVKNRQKIMTFFSRRGIHVFNTSIRLDTDIDKGHMKRKTVIEFNAAAAGALDYSALTEEIATIVRRTNKE